MRHRTKHNISASNTHRAEQRQSNNCSVNKITLEVEKGELPSKQSTQSARCHMYKGTYVKGVKFSTFTICVLSLLLCSIGVMMYWFQLHTMMSVFEQSEGTIQSLANRSKVSIMSIDKKDNNTVSANESNQTPIKVQLPFIPLRDRVEVHLAQNIMINFTSMESHLFDELDVIAFVLPPVIQNRISQIKLESFLQLGTRVAGTNREGHLYFLLRDALKQLHTHNSVHLPSQTVPSHEEDVSTLPMQSAWWSLSWDNFTEDGPSSFSNLHTSNKSPFSNPISFANVIFTFAGGRAYNEQYENQEHLSEEQGKKVIHSPTSTNTETANTNTTERNHIVLAAHWDSKWEPIGLLGACDSAVPLLMLTRLMQNVATLSEMSAQLHAIAEEEEPNLLFDEYYMCNDNHNTSNCSDSRLTHALREILSPIQYHYLIEYYFGISNNEGLVNNMTYNTNISNSSSRSTNKTDTTKHKSKIASQRAEKQFLDWIERIDALPPITIIMFDGEEAFEEWQGNDNTYGSRHLAARWRREQWQTPKATQPSLSANVNSTSDAKNESTVSKYISIALFVLLDLLGTRGAELHNFFPSFSGAFYKSLSQIERHGRQRALEQSIVMAKEFARGRKQQQQQHINKSVHSDMLQKMSNLVDYNLVQEAIRHITSHKKIPEIWHRYGAPHEMFTLFDFKHSEMRWLAQERAKFNSQKEKKEKEEEYYEEKEELLKRFSLEHTYDIMQTVKTPLNTSTRWTMLQELNRNVFFSREEAALHKWGLDDAHFTGIEDDHKHWLATERVLHLIAAPFPEEWHTLADNGSNIDHGTVVDVNRILWQFILQLGKHVKY